MIYVVYKVFIDEPNKGYYWGKWDDPIKLAYACFDMADTGVDGIKIVAYDGWDDVKPEIEW